jgi:hypothetical protein
MSMSTTSRRTPEEALERAEAQFTKKEAQRREATTAMADYRAEQEALLERTAKLRALRMAREAAGKVRVPVKPPEATGKAPLAAAASKPPVANKRPVAGKRPAAGKAVGAAPRKKRSA